MEVSQSSSRSLILKSLNSQQKLLAVSKLQPIEKIRALYNEGQRDFAENYVQEALEKIKSLEDLSINWHLIGPIQKNKVRLLEKKFAYLHAINSLELATKISEEAMVLQHTQKVFMQINLSGEVTKSGFTPDDFIKQWPQLSSLAGLQIVGLMTMPPLENDPEKNRPYFKELKKIANKLQLTELSMGTSQDYKIALEEGATWVRIGTILFGERHEKRG